MRVLFREEQGFRQRWLWVMLLAGLVITLGLFGYGMVQQLLLGQPWGDRPMSDVALTLTTMGLLLFEGLLLWLFYRLRLVTEVRRDGLYIRFRPLREKHIPCHSIVSCAARQYRPLAEYGGWGIRRGRGGWAYNVSGEHGVQLELEGGKRLLVGSQRAEELAAVLTEQCRIRS
jgi:hypothetical protein